MLGEAFKTFLISHEGIIAACGRSRSVFISTFILSLRLNALINDFIHRPDYGFHVKQCFVHRSALKVNANSLKEASESRREVIEDNR